jgi:ribosomal protein L11 methyltransferase
MSNYLEVIFTDLSEESSAVLNYYLGEKGVESIVEDEGFTKAYYTAEKWEEVKSYFDKWSPDVHEVKNENWNAVWEASFEPVKINEFCYVRAPFHPALENSEVIDLILEPKMAFGTAHHETTYMMMSQMEDVDFSGKRVFDFGCGTAILSILAEKLGAEAIYAIDIEDNAIENAIYNAEINGCSKIRCEVKTLEQTEAEDYDVILANINRAVLLSSAGPLVPYLKTGGTLLLSGILLSDESLVKNQYLEAGFTHLETIEKGEWKCIKFTIF